LFAAHLLRNDRTQARDGRWFSGADEFKYVEGVTSKTETFAGVRDENNTNLTPVSSVHTDAWSGFHACGRYPCLP
jgi:hypothetical protein